MILSSDLILTHPLWERADEELCNKNGLAIFNRLVDVYLIACAIGIKEDKTILKIDEPLINPKNIGRNTYQSQMNTDLSDTLSFLLQNALINSSTIDFDIDTRLKLAFDPDFEVSKLSAASFLTGFANYGIEQIFNHITSKSSITAVAELYRYFHDLQESKYDDILKYLTLEDIV